MVKKIISASLGNCVHAISIFNFLKLGEELGYETEYIGPATPVGTLVDMLWESDAEIVALGHRLTPNVTNSLLNELKMLIQEKEIINKIYVFIGTPSTAKIATKSGLFDAIFDGYETSGDIIYFLKGHVSGKPLETRSSSLIEKIYLKRPFPLIRHHFGLPSLEETIEGAKEIAEAKVLDILSIGTDQNAQEHFFHTEEMDTTLDGSGGVPIRSSEDLERIYSATRCGNYPLVRCYSGTRNLIKWAQLLKYTINNAWGAVPLCWYSQLDGRSRRPLLKAINENQEAIKWYANNNIPVEVNESHQWALRYTSDIIEVATAFIASYNAKKLGVKHYVMQYMFDTPPSITTEMDLAKMLAKIELIEAMHDEKFTSYRMVRTGLASLSPHPHIAKGQLAASITIAMSLSPHIVHVVGYSEGDHIITPKEVIESCNIAKGAINGHLFGMPNVASVPSILKRKEELIDEVSILLDAIKSLADIETKDPLTNPHILANAVEIGLLDAPFLKGNKCARGNIKTKIINGACHAVDPDTNLPLTEEERVARIKCTKCLKTNN